MKKIKLEFRKEVISTLNESELARIQGGNTAFSYNSCPTVDGPCTATSECTDQDSWQGKCFSDLACGSRNTDPVLDHALDKHPSDYCLLVSDDDH
ncbi:class I lanthipeptide [Odoribacter laneus]|uniref:class I lanthipeptide n=1 Tax=Odoribacter laneus TaxID=626933 RepID=UPI003AB69C3E